MFLREGVLKICIKFTGEHSCRSATSIKLQSNFIEITLRRVCSHVNLLHIFKTPFLKNTSGRLILLITQKLSKWFISFAFCLFFFWGNGWLFKRSILISLFVIDFKKVLKHFLNLNTDKSVSTGLIKNGSILHFNHLYGFRSSSLLSQLELFKVLVFGKVCFNLMKLGLFRFIYFFFLLLLFIYFRFFVSFVFTAVRTIPPKENSPRLGLGFGLALGLGLGLGGNFPRGQLS